jgi:hypothetical protein
VDRFEAAINGVRHRTIVPDTDSFTALKNPDQLTAYRGFLKLFVYSLGRIFLVMTLETENKF